MMLPSEVNYGLMSEKVSGEGLWGGARHHLEEGEGAEPLRGGREKIRMWFRTWEKRTFVNLLRLSLLPKTFTPELLRTDGRILTCSEGHHVPRTTGNVTYLHDKKTSSRSEYIATQMQFVKYLKMYLVIISILLFCCRILVQDRKKGREVVWFHR